MHPLIREVLKPQLKKIPDLRPGYSVEVHQKIKEGEKERIQIFVGLVIRIGKGEGVEKTITVRKIVEGVGVEKIFPLHSKNVLKVVVKKKGKVRRAKLYYMRGRAGKSARLQESQTAAGKEQMEELIDEAVQAAAKKEKEQQKEKAAAEAGEARLGAAKEVV